MRGRGWCDGTLRSASRSAASRRESRCRAGGGFARGEGRGRATRRTGRVCVLWCMCPSMIGGRDWSATVASKGWDRSRRRVSIAPAATVRSPWIRSGVRRAPPPPPASRRSKDTGTRAMPVGDSCNRLRERGKEGGKEAGRIRPSGLTDPVPRDRSPKPTNTPTRGGRGGRPPKNMSTTRAERADQAAALPRRRTSSDSFLYARLISVALLARVTPSSA
jgi:hypothetical protein